MRAPLSPVKLASDSRRNLATISVPSNPITIKTEPEDAVGAQTTRYIVYDLETTGLGHAQAIQFAGMDLYSDATLNDVCKPTKKIHWGASMVHGYRVNRYGQMTKRGQVLSGVLGRQEAFQRFQDFLGLYDENYTRVVVIGYNNQTFDNKIIMREIPTLLSDKSLANKLYFFDVYRSIEKVKGQSYKLQNFYTREFGEESARAVEWHDGLADVKATRQLCRKFFNATQIYAHAENFQDYYCGKV